jgi:aryl-alcohol dehydrogenase-like predicted oxidoreductase
MEYRPLGKTGLTASVAGLGGGGNTRLGLGRGASFDDCMAVVRTAVDLGVNFLDTAEAYGTEEIVGAATRYYDRDRLVISTNAIFKAGEDTADRLFNQVRSALATSKRYTRAVLPPAILACSSSGTPARISARIFRDWGNVDSLCG